MMRHRVSRDLDPSTATATRRGTREKPKKGSDEREGDATMMKTTRTTRSLSPADGVENDKEFFLSMKQERSLFLSLLFLSLFRHHAR